MCCSFICRCFGDSVCFSIVWRRWRQNVLEMTLWYFWKEYLLTSRTNCDSFDEQLCRRHWFSIWVSGLKSVKKEQNSCHIFTSYWIEQKETGNENNSGLHLKVLLYWCLSWLICGWYFPDWCETKERKYFKIDFYSCLMFVLQPLTGLIRCDISLPVDTNFPPSSSALGYGK